MRIFSKRKGVTNISLYIFIGPIGIILIDENPSKA